MPKKKTNRKKKIQNETGLKKIIYVILTIFLGKLLGFIAFETISINFISSLEKNGLPVEYEQIFWLVYSPLPAYLFWLFISIGVIGGFFLGMTWWRIVYIEHRHWSKAGQK